MTSPFLARDPGEWIAANELCFALWDAYPASPGHALVIPRREVATWFDASMAERTALLELVDRVRELLEQRQPKPDGYNVGVNVGRAAGQTVMHLHVHVIPRYAGDVADPRGGVRHCIPRHGNYLRDGHVPRGGPA